MESFVKRAFFILFSLSCGVNLILSQTDCFPIQKGCTRTQSFTAVIEVADYPECPISVSYDLRVCQGVSQIANVSVLAIPFGTIPQCSDVIVDLLQAIGGTSLQLETFMTRFWSSIESGISDQIFQQTLQAGQTNNTLPLLYCGSGLSTFTAAFYRGSCVSFCFNQDDRGALSVSQISCGSTCCVEKKTYCINPSTGNTVISTIVEQVAPGECISITPPSCQGNTIFQSPCFELCVTE